MGLSRKPDWHEQVRQVCLGSGKHSVVVGLGDGLWFGNQDRGPGWLGEPKHHVFCVDHRQSVFEVSSVKRNGQRVAEEGAGQVFLGVPGFRTTGGKNKLTIGELHGDLGISVGHHGDAPDGVLQGADLHNCHGFVGFRKQGLEVRELRVQHAGGCLAGIGLQTEESFPAKLFAHTDGNVQVISYLGVDGSCVVQQRFCRDEQLGSCGFVGGFPVECAYSQAESVGGREEHGVAVDVHVHAGEHG